MIDTSLFSLDAAGATRLLDRARDLGRMRVAVVHPCDVTSLSAVLEARAIGLIDPVVVAPAARLQPIAVPEVAARLAELAMGAPQGRAADIGGPQPLEARELYAQWKAATGGRRGLLRLRLPGRIFRALNEGAALVPGEPYGRETFAEYLQAKYRA